MTRRASVLGLLLVAGLAALVASGQPWWRAVGDEPAGSGIVTFSGADATGGLSQALAVVVLAGVLLSLVLASRGRRVLAALLALAGLGVAAVGTHRQQPSEAAVRTRFRQLSLVEQFALDGTAWSWVYALAGVVVIAGAVLLFVAAPGWPRRRRFERRVQPEASMDDPAEAWAVLDAGLDPTSTRDDRDDDRDDGRDDGSDTPPRNNDPDVRTGTTTDTMVEEQNSGADRNSDAGQGSGGGTSPAARRRNEEQ